MKKAEIRKAIDHVVEMDKPCGCIHCYLYQDGTYLDGLRQSLK